MMNRGFSFNKTIAKVPWSTRHSSVLDQLNQVKHGKSYAQRPLCEVALNVWVLVKYIIYAEEREISSTAQRIMIKKTLNIMIIKRTHKILQAHK